MTTLLRLCLQKIAPYKPFWIMLAMFTVVLPGGYYVFGDIPITVNRQEFRINFFYDFPNIWYFITYSASWFNLFFGIIIITLTTNEISFRTMRQNVIDGMSRDQVVLEKFVLILLLALYAFVLIGIMGLAFGFSNAEQIDFAQAMEKSNYLLGYFVQVFAYMTVALLVALTIKRTGFAIVLYIAYTWIEMIANLILEYFNDALGGWLPHAALSSLSINPIRLVQPDLQAQTLAFDVPDDIFGKPLYLTLTYIVIFGALCFNAVRNRDLS